MRRMRVLRLERRRNMVGLLILIGLVGEVVPGHGRELDGDHGGADGEEFPVKDMLAEDVIHEEAGGKDARGFASERGGAEAVVKEALIDGGAEDGEFHGWSSFGVCFSSLKMWSTGQRKTRASRRARGRLGT